MSLSQRGGTSVPSARDAVPPCVRLQIAGPPRNRPVPGRGTAGWQRPQNDGARNAGASGCVRRRLRLGPSRGEPLRKGQPASAVRVPESCPMRPARASHRLRVPSPSALALFLGMDPRGDCRDRELPGGTSTTYTRDGEMQPVGGEHALTVEHPARSRLRTTCPVARAANPIRRDLHRG